MSVNLPVLPELQSVGGVRLGTAGAAIKSEHRDDVALLVLDPGATVAGVFTRSSFRAPPVDIAQARIALGDVRALLINSGNANAATGAAGLEDAKTLCARAAAALNLQPEQVIPFSTGVIGERLPVERIGQAIERCVDTLGAGNWEAAARAIMTTDTQPKAESRVIDLSGARVSVTGIAKGSGMIRPDMATMLAFICCDASVSQTCLNRLVREVADLSFNRITIDGDTSTNDAFVLAATAKSSAELIDDYRSSAYRQLRDALADIAVGMAQRIVRDGEGATKFVTVRVSGGLNEAECLQVAYTIAESPLVKTALFASDPNWGRFCMAIGRAGVVGLEQSSVGVYVNGLCIVANGQKHPAYREEDGAAVMSAEELEIHVSLGRGEAVSEIWTSDLSYEYVRINAEYRT